MQCFAMGARLNYVATTRALMWTQCEKAVRGERKKSLRRTRPGLLQTGAGHSSNFFPEWCTIAFDAVRGCDLLAFASATDVQNALLMTPFAAQRVLALRDAALPA